VDFALSDHHRHRQQRGSDLKHPSSPPASPSAPPPAKRTRTSEPWSPKQVVDGAFVSREPLSDCLPPPCLAPAFRGRCLN
jgi:hypothetical protein